MSRQAATKTKSEALFESFCGGRGLVLDRIEEASSRRPDYRLVLPETEVIIEVKELSPSKEERAIIEQDIGTFDAANAFHWGIPGEKIRKKIDSAVPQLKALSQNRLPTMLVLFDPVGFWPELLDDSAVRVAMYGTETILISNEVAPEGGAKILDRWHGGRRRATSNQNTTLSAIAILREVETRASLDVFHNWFASVPLDPLPFRADAIRHFRLVGSPEIRLGNWTEC